MFAGYVLPFLCWSHGQPHTVAFWKCWKEAGGFGCTLNTLNGAEGQSYLKVCILTLSFSLKCLKNGQIQAWKVAFMWTFQLTSHDVFFKLHMQLQMFGMPVSKMVWLRLWSDAAPTFYSNLSAIKQHFIWVWFC